MEKRREDCWSDGETSALISSWGHLFLSLNRGNLRRSHWQDVADAVNSRPAPANRPPRSDSQCKNRVDTLKKKFKLHKAKISGGALPGHWPFYSRLELLLGPSPPPPPPPQIALPLPSDRKSIPFRDSFVGEQLKKNFAAVAAAAAKEEEEEEEEEEEDGGTRSCSGDEGRGGKRKRGIAGEIERFGEMYERVEREKQRGVREMERERMEFLKGMEIRRMKMFVDVQVEVEKIKRARREEEEEEDEGNLKIASLFSCCYALL